MQPHSLSLVTTLVLVFSAAISGGLLARYFKLPMLVGYILAGVLVGNVFPTFTNKEFLDVIAQTGVTLLLFALGIEFSFHRLRNVLGTVMWVAVLQILLSLLLFVVFFTWSGFSFPVALFFASAASLSSTAIVVKLLGERGELDTVPGEVSVAWLVIQDISVIPLVVLLSAVVAISGSATISVGESITLVMWSVLKSFVIVAGILYVGKHVVPLVLGKVAALGNREIFLLTTVGLVLCASLVSYALNLSAALGAFIAGLIVAETSQNHTVFAEIRPLRDLFAVVFFVSLGMALPIAVFINNWLLLLGIVTIVALVKWSLILALCRLVGYHRKTAFLVALSLGQMSEFGFILAKEGVGLGAVSQELSVLIVAVIFLSILVTTPLVSSGHQLYYWLVRIVGDRVPRLFPVEEHVTSAREELSVHDHIVLCGYGRVGKYIGRALVMAGIPFLVVDYNHITVSSLRSKGIEVVYGDPADKDVLDYAQVDRAKALVVAIPDRHTQELVIGNALTLNRRIHIFCRTHHEEDQAYLKSLGVGTVVQPEFEAAITIIERLLPEFGLRQEEIPGKISRLKIEHGVG